MDENEQNLFLEIKLDSCTRDGKLFHAHRISFLHDYPNHFQSHQLLTRFLINCIRLYRNFTLCAANQSPASITDKTTQFFRPLRFRKRLIFRLSVNGNGLYFQIIPRHHHTLRTIDRETVYVKMETFYVLSILPFFVHVSITLSLFLIYFVYAPAVPK